MFYYEQMFNTALSGIMSAGLMSSVLTVAYGILLASLLFSAYEAWTKGGDVRALGVAGVKYLALGALFMNDGAVYERVFRDVLGAFNQISHTRIVNALNLTDQGAGGINRGQRVDDILLEVQNPLRDALNGGHGSADAAQQRTNHILQRAIHGRKKRSVRWK